MRILTAADVRKALPMRETIEAMKTAYAALSNQKATVPLRTQLSIPRQEATSLFMPALLDQEEEQALGVKIVSVFPNNPGKNLPLIYASVIVLDPETGETIALLEGGSLTAIRTGAGAGAATDLLARPDSKVAAIFGAGVQARTQLEAICTVRKIETVWVCNIDPEQTKDFINELKGNHPIPNDLRSADSPRQALSDADIISTATTSSTPVFAAKDLKPGAHINGIGSYLPSMQEIPAEAIAQALVWVDSKSAALAETGDFIQPIEQGIISEEHIYGEIGELVTGQKPGRQTDSQITFFKSVGIAIQDTVAGKLALKNAERMNLGQIVNL